MLSEGAADREHGLIRHHMPTPLRVEGMPPDDPFEYRQVRAGIADGATGWYNSVSDASGLASAIGRVPSP
jgi:hypothetical protein